MEDIVVIQERLLLTLAEVIQLTGYGRTFLMQKLLDGSIPSLKVGKTRRVPRAGLEKWIEEQTTQTTEDR